MPRSLAVVAVVVSLLAGCADPPASGPVLAPPSPAPIPSTQDFQAVVYIGTPASCAVVVCSGGVSPATLYRAADNASIQALRFDVEDEPLLDGSPVAWKVTCKGPVDEDPGCIRTLAEGRDELPVHIEVPGLNLTPGTEVFLELVAPTFGVPLVDFPVLVGTQGTPVRGSVDLLEIPGFEGPPRVFEVLPISFDGHSGPCILVPGVDCSQYPGGTQSDLDVEGLIVAANLTMTWDSQTPLDEELVLEIHEYFCPGSCPDPVRVQGPSPLVLEVAPIRLGGTSSIAVYHVDAVDDPLGYGSYHGTRTPVHVEGTVTVEIEPVEE